MSCVPYSTTMHDYGTEQKETLTEDDLDEEEEDGCFNMESSEETAELESQLRSNAIGSTLYDKKWVIEAVLRVVRKLDEGGGSFESSSSDEEEEDDLKCIADMTVEADVCVFLHESGALRLLRDGVITRPDVGASGTLAAAVAVLSNAFRVREIFRELASDRQNLSALVSSVYDSVSAPVLAGAFSALTTMLRSYSEDAAAASGKFDPRGLVESHLCSGDFVGRLSALLSAAQNPDLLESTAAFLLALYEFFLSVDEPSAVLGGHYGDDSFVSALLEATRTSLDHDRGSFRFMEVLGYVATSNAVLGRPGEPLPESYYAGGAACEVATDYLERRGDCLPVSLVWRACEVIWAGWRVHRHDRSYAALVLLLSELGRRRAASEAWRTSSAEALADALDGALRRYREDHGSAERAEEGTVK